MGWAWGLATYFIIWWMLIFMVLPWGGRAVASEDVAKGRAVGAPTRPRLLVKMAVNSVLAGVVWGIVYLVVRSGAISFRGP